MQPSPSVPPSRGRAPAGQGPAAAVDAAIARALAAGDPRGLEDAYRRYADRLRAYCRSIVHDAAAASDAVHDTYVVASQRAGELRDPGRLRAWLYAIARNECLRILRTQRRQAPLEAAAEMSGEPVDFAAGVRAEQLRELVHTASAGLADGDREVIELAIRHDLSAPDVASVLGVSPDHAHARLSRARASLERSLGALLVARTGTADCPELGTMLAGWDGQLTALLRKRLARHIASCEVCAERQRRQLQPSQLLAGFTALPFALVAEELWPRIQLTCGGYGPGPAGMGSDGVGSDGAAAGGTEPGGAAPGGAGPGGAGPDGAGPGGVGPGGVGSGGVGLPGAAALGGGAAAAVAARAGRFDPASGFPVPLDRPQRRALLPALAAAAVLLLVLGGGVLMIVLPRSDADRLVWGDPRISPTPAVSAEPTATPSAPASASPSVGASTPAPPPSRSPAAPPPPPSPSASPSRPSPSVLVVKVSGTPRCNEKGWELPATAWVSGGTPEMVVLHWKTGNGDTGQVEMTWSGKNWQGTARTFGPNDRIQWWATARAADGGTGQSESQPAYIDCPR